MLTNSLRRATRSISCPWFSGAVNVRHRPSKLPNEARQVTYEPFANGAGDPKSGTRFGTLFTF
jgi:hypothetical protein